MRPTQGYRWAVRQPGASSWLSYNQLHRISKMRWTTIPTGSRGVPTCSYTTIEFWPFLLISVANNYWSYPLGNSLGFKNIFITSGYLLWMWHNKRWVNVEGFICNREKKEEIRGVRKWGWQGMKFKRRGQGSDARERQERMMMLGRGEESVEAGRGSIWMIKGTLLKETEERGTELNHCYRHAY